MVNPFNIFLVDDEVVDPPAQHVRMLLDEESDAHVCLRRIAKAAGRNLTTFQKKTGNGLWSIRVILIPSSINGCSSLETTWDETSCRKVADQPDACS
jgi:hypothetical protein